MSVRGVGVFEVAYPDDLLSDGERVVAHRHPHVKMLFFPILVVLVVFAIGTWLAVVISDAAPPWDMVGLLVIGVLGALLVAWLALAPFVRWRTTHFIVTTDRVIAREGVLKRTGIDIPMARINSVQFEHGLVDRLFRCGSLIIESASDEPLTFDDIPRVERMHSLIYRQINDNPYDDYGDFGDYGNRAYGHEERHGRA